MASRLTMLPVEELGEATATSTARALAWHWRLALASAAFLSAAALGEAATASHKQHHPSAPVTTSRDIENETTGTIPIKAPQRQAVAAGSATSRNDEPLPPPFHLPAAPRTRMRDCGLKWQAMKMSGEAGDDIWRAFATRCLSAANGPLDNKHSDR